MSNYEEDYMNVGIDNGPVLLTDFWLVVVRAEESIAVKVNHMIRCFSYPNFGFPGDVGSILTELSSMWECCYIHFSDLACRKSFFKL